MVPLGKTRGWDKPFLNAYWRHWFWFRLVSFDFFLVSRFWVWLRVPNTQKRNDSGCQTRERIGFCMQKQQLETTPRAGAAIRKESARRSRN